MPSQSTQRISARATSRRQLAAWTTVLLLTVPLNGLGATNNGSNGSVLPSHQVTFRHYRATAYINLLAITIFSRGDVGGGYASIDESEEGPGQSVVMKFVSGSSPERAHGLNRLGLIQEVVKHQPGQSLESEYFGFITSNGEESLAQAKAALDNGGKDKVNFVAAEGSAHGETIRYAKKNMLLPATYRWSNVQDFARGVQSDFYGEGLQYQQSRGSEGDTLTFLYAVRVAILSKDTHSEARVMHNGKFFRMRTERIADRRAGEDLRKVGLTEAAAHVVRLNGTIRNEKTNEETTYKLWYDETSANALPLRFEFRPKAYLRLVFDADPLQTRPSDLMLLTALR